MKITQEFEVAQSPTAVFQFFQNIPDVAQCLPGADLTEDRGEGKYAGKVSVKLGPMTASFEGEAEVASDDGALTGHIKGRGADRRGGSRGQVEVDYSVSATDTGAKVVVEADITISGAAAQFGRTGLLNQMSQRLIQEFVECLEAKLGAASETEASQIQAQEVKGFSLFFSSLGSSIAGFFKKLFARKPA